eukprot:TRINITY_DN25248_c0_g1_i1.p1 TRINITY_DN25248_c0_g1~~TRINITY_DN25248_c0_g1_i1.p1  ORF type:complete len:237 (-),score=39.33 TRINITY_DN25248_c0_g1_i1:13-723(-)
MTEVDYAAFCKLPRRKLFGEEAERESCVICHEGFTGSRRSATLLPCASFSNCPCLFHGDCLLRWLEKQRSCPLCRRSFEGELGSVGVEEFTLPTSPTVYNPHDLSSWSEAARRCRGAWGPQSPQARDLRISEVISESEHLTRHSRSRQSASRGALETSPSAQGRSTRRRASRWEEALGSFFTLPSSPSLASRQGTAGRRHASAGAPGLFTPTERLDPDTRRTMQRRIAALHRLQVS